VSATVEQPTSRVSSSGIRWIRVVVAGILLEFALVAVLVQGVQIDTDHWRHLYLLLGCMWGLLGATLAYEARLRSAIQT